MHTKKEYYTTNEEKNVMKFRQLHNESGEGLVLHYTRRVASKVDLKWKTII